MKKILSLIIAATLLLFIIWRCSSPRKSLEQELNTMPNEMLQGFVDKALEDHPNYCGNPAVRAQIEKEFEQFIMSNDPVKVLENVCFEAEFPFRVEDKTHTKDISLSADGYLLFISATIPDSQASTIDIQKLYRVKDITVDSIRILNNLSSESVSLYLGTIEASKIELEEVPGKRSKKL